MIKDMNVMSIILRSGLHRSLGYVFQYTDSLWLLLHSNSGKGSWCWTCCVIIFM